MSDDLVTDTTSTETSDVEVLEEDSKEETPIDETPEVEESEVEEEIPEEKEEEEEPEEEEEEVSDSGIVRPSWKELKEKYPGIEKNAELREVYFREKAFSEVYPTVADARIAADKANTLDYFDDSLREGDPTVLLNALASTSGEVTAALAEKFLPSLYDLSPKLFARATHPFLSSILNDAYDFAQNRDDKNLAQSVANLCKYLYGDFKIPPRPGKTNQDPEVLREKQRLRAERENLFFEKRDEFIASMDKSIDRQLGKALEEGLSDIDNDFVKRAIIKDSVSEMKAIVRTDPDFRANIGRFLAQAAKNGFSSDWKTRIISAYLGRAKGLALTARSKIKAAAIGKRQSDDRLKSTRRVEGADKKDSRSSGKVSKRDFYAKYSDDDIISGKV